MQHYLVEGWYFPSCDEVKIFMFIFEHPWRDFKEAVGEFLRREDMSKTTEYFISPSSFFCVFYHITLAKGEICTLIAAQSSVLYSRSNNFFRTDIHSSFVVGMAQIWNYSRPFIWSKRMHYSHLSHPIKDKISSTTWLLTMKVGWIVLFLCWRIFVPIFIDFMNCVNNYHQKGWLPPISILLRREDEEFGPGPARAAYQVSGNGLFLQQS